MSAGDPCKNKDCGGTQPCPLHTRLGKDRVRTRNGDNEELAQVHTLFTDEKQAHPSSHGVPSGKRKESGVEDKRKNGYVKQRIGKRWTQIHEEVARGDYTWDEFVEQLDAEELAHGRLKAEDGTFRGRPPDFIPRAFFLACQREMVSRFNRKIQSNLETATDELIRLGTSDTMEPKDRVKVLMYLVERVVGKVPDRVEVSAVDPWETIIGDILAEAPEGTAVPNYVMNRTAGSDDEPE